MPSPQPTTKITIMLGAAKIGGDYSLSNGLEKHL